MKIFSYICFMLCCTLYITTNAQIQGDNNWNSTPYFIDNFNVSGRSWRSDFKDIPLLKWYAFSRESGVLHGHNEHQVYQKQNCIFDDTNQKMILRATWEGDYGNLECGDYEVPGGYSCDPTHPSLYYFSGEIDVHDYFNSGVEDFLYGYFEIKCKLPVHSGAFPAFWLWGGGTTHYEEIDIFEYSWRFTDPLHNSETPGLGSPRCFTTGFYFNDAGSSHIPFARNYPIVSSSKPDLTAYHTFSCEWSPNRLVWYFDGEIVNEYYANNVPYRPMALKTNYALDDYVLDEDEEPYTSFFPDEMIIDYIKVHKLKCDCNTNAYIPSNTALANFQYEVKKSISIGSSGNNINIPTSSKVVFRATDYVQITNSFTVPNGSELELIIHPCPE
jgi:hypothetical protein